jgi:hypothetical protein
MASCCTVIFAYSSSVGSSLFLFFFLSSFSLSSFFLPSFSLSLLSFFLSDLLAGPEDALVLVDAVFEPASFDVLVVSLSLSISLPLAVCWVCDPPPLLAKGKPPPAEALLFLTSENKNKYKLHLPTQWAKHVF